MRPPDMSRMRAQSYAGNSAYSSDREQAPKRWKMGLKIPGRARSSSVATPTVTSSSCPMKSCLKSRPSAPTRPSFKPLMSRLSSSAPNHSSFPSEETCAIVDTTPAIPEATPELSSSPQSYFLYRPLSSLSSPTESIPETVPIQDCCSNCWQGYEYGLEGKKQYTEHWSKGAAKKRVQDLEENVLPSISKFNLYRVDEVKQAIGSAKLGSKDDQSLPALTKEEEEDAEDESGERLEKRPTQHLENSRKTVSAPAITKSTEPSSPKLTKFDDSPCWTTVLEKEAKRAREEREKQNASSWWVRHNLQSILAGAAGAKTF